MKIRIILDANIYVSALIKGDSTPARVIRTIVENEKYELVLSEDILIELQRVLFYPKIRKRIQRTNQELLDWLETLKIISHIVAPLYQHDLIIEDDPSDDIYLIAALESHARYIVSGDQHLLKFDNYEGIKIMSAVNFLQHRIFTS